MLDALLNVEDETGRKLEDDEIIDVLLMYLNAGHESSGHIIMWATVFLQAHPHYLHKAKGTSFQRAGEFWHGSKPFTWILKSNQIQENSILQDGK
ncbi:hypothetical protein QYF36_002023 [Acer negundo]|nr:hypothetical protein QYF36_002023 [Acer negundo]